MTKMVYRKMKAVHQFRKQYITRRKPSRRQQTPAQSQQQPSAQSWQQGLRKSSISLD